MIEVIFLLRMRLMFLILAIVALGGGWFYPPVLWLALVLTLVWSGTWLARPVGYYGRRIEGSDGPRTR